MLNSTLIKKEMELEESSKDNEYEIVSCQV